MTRTEYLAQMEAALDAYLTQGSVASLMSFDDLDDDAKKVARTGVAFELARNAKAATLDVDDEIGDAVTAISNAFDEIKTNLTTALKDNGADGERARAVVHDEMARLGNEINALYNAVGAVV